MDRLTERDEYGNADIIGVDSGDLQLDLEFDEFNRDALNRLCVTPEEVQKISDETSEMCVMDKECFRRIMKYIKAEAEGRLIVLPETGIGDLSDGHHTFNGLYYQRMVLFAALVKAYKGMAWKSHRHDNGELCFGGGWFIVGIDTPVGGYTYHYKDDYWDWFDCEEIPTGKHWDGHTEEDVTRLLSLTAEAALREAQ